MKYLLSVFGACILVIVILLVVFTPEPCEHKEVSKYSFASYKSTAMSDVCSYCRKCNERLTGYSLFEGDPADKSYLKAIEENSDGGEIIPGEYYTVTAIVPLGFMGYTSTNVWLNCKVENEEFIIYFSVDFREEFEEQVSAIEKGDTITFRGRFYDEGCGFTDCELISK